MLNESCSLKFMGDGLPDSAEIAEFVFLFRAVYAATVRMNMTRSTPTQEGVQELAQRAREYLASLNVGQLDGLFYRDRGKHKLLIKRISHESPTEIIFEGLLIAIAAAVILSGGKFKLGNSPLGSVLEAELAPLGDGIKRLRSAFERRTKARVGYGVRSRKVKLSKDEMKELFQQDRKQRGHGGFQRKLVSLQDRVDRQTGELELSPSDIDFILRHGSEAYKGGFQQRIRKIFDDHFKFNDSA